MKLKRILQDYCVLWKRKKKKSLGSCPEVPFLIFKIMFSLSPFYLFLFLLSMRNCGPVFFIQGYNKQECFYLRLFCLSLHPEHTEIRGKFLLSLNSENTVTDRIAKNLPFSKPSPLSTPVLPSLKDPAHQLMGLTLCIAETSHLG